MTVAELTALIRHLRATRPHWTHVIKALQEHRAAILDRKEV